MNTMTPQIGYLTRFISVNSTGDQKRKTCSADDSKILLNSNILRRWPTHVVPMERTKRIYEHELGMWTSEYQPTPEKPAFFFHLPPGNK